MPAIVDKETCVGCGTCVDACPAAAITLKEEIAVVDNEACTECETCVEACPTQAIKVEKK
jgi:Fe-S-cluster-containing hydrogenase component 2